MRKTTVIKVKNYTKRVGTVIFFLELLQLENATCSDMQNIYVESKMV